MDLRLLSITAFVLSVATVSQAGHGPAVSPLVQEPPPLVFSARSELVVLHVTVKDKQGSYVSGLTSEAFTVLEDGQRQHIEFFASQDAPVDVGLLIDSSGSMRPNRERVVAAAGTFAETSNPQDEIFALVFNEWVRPALPARVPFTSDAETLRQALSTAISAQGRTALYDAILAGLEYLKKGSEPRKVLVVVSDGGDNASAATFEQVLRKTQVSNTVIYTIALADPLEHEANPKRLRQLAHATGGQAFEPRKITQVTDVLRQIARDIRSTYTVGYTPAQTERDGHFRRVRVLVAAPGRRGFSVRTRQGYVVEER